jgi:hypothetical protein
MGFPWAERNFVPTEVEALPTEAHRRTLQEFSCSFRTLAGLS